MKAMRTWDIAKLLLERCDSCQDVDQVIETLNDTLALQELCRILSSFASHPRVDAPPLTLGGRPTAVSEPERQAADDDVKVLPDISKDATAEQLGVLFRSCGMTNKQVVQWFETNFKIDVPIRKGSLRQYLMKVLAGADLGLANRILATAQGRLPGDSRKKSDIGDYWDRLDKQFSDV